MSKVTSLSRFRKTKVRAEKRARADENAVKFGRSKAQKQREEADQARARAALDGKLRE